MWSAKSIMQSMRPAMLCRFPTPALQLHWKKRFSRFISLVEKNSKPFKNSTRKENLYKLMKARSGIPNQSIAIYRSIFECLAVNRGPIWHVHTSGCSPAFPVHAMRPGRENPFLALHKDFGGIRNI